jgi:CheY-like chemotaxis protein
MVYGFAGQSNGTVRIYSEVGQGTRVCLYLPRHFGEAAGREDIPSATDAPRAEAQDTVLVVDDEVLVRMVASEILEQLGYTVLEAGDGPEALRVLQETPHIDVLVSDVGLPKGMNGRQLADAARVTRPDLQVLFVTGYAENAVLNHGRLAPGMHVMTKPFLSEEFGRRVKELVNAARETRRGSDSRS